MAGEMNVQFQANLTADPELTQVGGKTVCKLRLAHNTRTKRGDEWVNDETWWVDGTVWPSFDGDPFPENVAGSLSKGDAVDVVARLKREPWESREGKSGVSYRASVQSIGASMKRAVVQVSRNERGAAAGSQAQSGWGAPAQAQSAWGQAAAPAAAAAQGSFSGFDDEEAF